MALNKKKLTKIELCTLEMYIENLQINHGLSDKVVEEVKQKIDELYKNAPE